MTHKADQLTCDCSGYVPDGLGGRRWDIAPGLGWMSDLGSDDVLWESGRSYRGEANEG